MVFRAEGIWVPKSHPRDGESHSSQEIRLQVFCSSLTPRLALSTAIESDRCAANVREPVNQETWTNKQKNAAILLCCSTSSPPPSRQDPLADCWHKGQGPSELTCRMSSICITEEGNLDCANSSKSPSFTFSKTRSRKPSREIWRMVSSCP